MSENNQKDNPEERICTGSACGDLLSAGSLGWQVRIIESTCKKSVTLGDAVSFSSPCFAGARVGDIWAVKYEPSFSCFGKIQQAILLQPAGR